MKYEPTEAPVAPLPRKRASTDDHVEVEVVRFVFHNAPDFYMPRKQYLSYPTLLACAIDKGIKTIEIEFVIPEVMTLGEYRNLPVWNG